MDLELLRETLASGGEPRYRADQVWAWVARGAGSYEEMSDLPSALRDACSPSDVPLSTLRLRARGARSRRDGQGAAANHRRPPARDGADALPRRAPLGCALSSQSGCPLTCTFCATGRMRFARNLTAR